MGEAMIASFSGKNRFLSNFSPSLVEYDGMTYPTVEHAFQAAKTLDRHERIPIQKAETPGQAKRMGKRVKLRYDWEEIKLAEMEFLLRQKFLANSPESQDLLGHLLDTYPDELVEGNDWGDTYWGMVWNSDHSRWEGENNLGRLLMKIRDEVYDDN
jgi:ribA/ribD-fused uncharacterized protein